MAISQFIDALQLEVFVGWVSQTRNPSIYELKIDSLKIND